MRLDPVTRSLVALDIEGYSRRKNEGHLELRDALRAVRDEAFTRIGVMITANTEIQDQGDAFLILVPPEVPKSQLVEDLTRELRTALRRFNESRLPEQYMRLRVAVHAGEVHLDGTGFGGEAVIAVMRLIEADDLRKALKTAPHDLAVIVSDQLYRDVVVQRYRGIDPAEYWRVEVARKTFHEPAWIRVPGIARPPQTGPDSQAAGEPTEPSPQSAGQRDWDRSPASVAGGVSFGGPASFSGTTSLFGPAAGRDVNLQSSPTDRSSDG
jgi:class 3 adenylate cyclase